MKQDYVDWNSPEAWRRWRISRGQKPLLGRHNIFCESLDAEIDLARFIRVFGDVWRRVPLWARRALLKEWRPLVVVPPLVTIAPTWEHLSEVGESRVCGEWFPDHHFYFRSDAVKNMPDDVLSIVIAHELAHPINRICDRNTNPENFRDGLFLSQSAAFGSLERQQEEEKTILLHTAWGFHIEPLYDWATKHKF